jgi:16S rRNA C967 or C1407 C5-methylase (RsmB/RsmF family)/NOL1/NOP2/fmu family ribosome biogenesis protein
MIDIELLKATVAPLAIADLDALAEALEHLPRPAIRLRPGIPTTSLPFAVEQVTWHPRGFFVVSDDRPGAQIGYAAGDYYIQDAASLLAVSLLDPQPAERVCDLCASPGGKSTAILEAIGDDGWLLSNEAVESRLAMLQFNLARHGATNYVVARADPSQLASSLREVFDAVLVDAPCSGQSLVSRGRQSASAFYPRTVEHCAARQARILDDASQLVRPGGRLIYSTCTFAIAENELQVESFLEQNPSWSLSPFDALRPWQSEHGIGHYRLWPHRHGCGGAYAARLVRNSDPLAPGERVKPRTSHLRRAPLPEESNEWGELDAATYRRDFQTFGWRCEPDDRLLPFAASGPEICFRKGATWFPSYALAMRRDKHWKPRAHVELDDRQAAQYLEGLSLPSELRGWLIATWNGRPLGWCKGDGTRLKNHLPKPARRK